MYISEKWLCAVLCALSCASNEKHNSGSSGGNTLWVQVPSSAPEYGEWQKVILHIFLQIQPESTL